MPEKLSLYWALLLLTCWVREGDTPVETQKVEWDDHRMLDVVNSAICFILNIIQQGDVFFGTLSTASGTAVVSIVVLMLC